MFWVCVGLVDTLFGVWSSGFGDSGFVFRFGGIGFWFCGYFGDFAGFGICLLRTILCGVGII